MQAIGGSPSGRRIAPWPIATATSRNRHKRAGNRPRGGRADRDLRPDATPISDADATS